MFSLILIHYIYHRANVNLYMLFYYYITVWPFNALWVFVGTFLFGLSAVKMFLEIDNKEIYFLHFFTFL